MICEWELIRAGAAVLTPSLYHSIPYSIECENKMWENIMEDQQIARLYVHFSFTATDGYFQGMLLYFLGTYGGALYLLYASAQKVTQIDICFLKLCMQIDLKHIFSKKSCVQIEFSETSTLFSKMQVNSKTYPFEFLFRLK